MSPEFIRREFTDEQLRAALADAVDGKPGTPQHAANLAFRATLQAELDWRDANGKHYSKSQWQADTVAWHSLIIERKRAGQSGFIPRPHPLWFER